MPVLEEFNPLLMEPIHAVYLGKPGRLPARVRAVLDFLMANVVLDGGLQEQLAQRPCASCATSYQINLV